MSRHTLTQMLVHEYKTFSVVSEKGTRKQIGIEAELNEGYSKRSFTVLGSPSSGRGS